MIRALELQHIRSYENGLFEFAEGVNIIVGPNASGKTNLLEAIHMACLGSGFKSSDGDMVAHGSTWGRIDMTIDDVVRSVKLQTEPQSKAYILDDIEKKRLVGPSLVPLVLFEPTHMQLLGGEPERRRAYIDGILSQAEPGFKTLLSSYKRTLAQRNRLLKQEHVIPDHIFVWDVRLSELAGQLVEYRVAYTAIVNERIVSDYRRVSGGEEVVELFYDSKLPIGSYADAHLKKLTDDFALDCARGFTGSGPHRDDIGVIIDGSDARIVASRGETRSIVLALKVAELAALQERLAVQPLLLLDDVFSELDGKRRRLLAEALKDVQTFITTTDADAIVKSFMKDYRVITTRKGSL